MRYFIFIILFIIAGCVNQTQIQTTRSWEGHYKDVESFKKATESISLEKDESIWIMSDRTLHRVLKNTEK